MFSGVAPNRAAALADKRDVREQKKERGEGRSVLS